MLSGVESHCPTAIVKRAAGPEIDIAAIVVQIPALAAACRPYCSCTEPVYIGSERELGGRGRLYRRDGVGARVTDGRSDVVRLRFEHVDHRRVADSQIGTMN